MYPQIGSSWLHKPTGLVFIVQFVGRAGVTLNDTYGNTYSFERFEAEFEPYGQSTATPETAQDDYNSVLKELKIGGEWLGAARRWIQWNVQGGSILNWDSPATISFRFSDFTELAREVAVAAILQERKDRARLVDQWRKVISLEAENSALRIKAEREASVARNVVIDLQVKLSEARNEIKRLKGQ